jgi:dipeptidyl aminopeptidase/acylaminoacyl peptidase
VGGLNPAVFVTPERVEYVSFDQRTINAWYYRPRTADAAHKAPVIVSIHGGPESQATAAFSAQIQYWVNELGAAVIVPNVRGSSGYGKRFLALDDGMKREDSVRDIGELLLWAGERPELDKARIGVYGGSYGGYMVLATMFRFPERIRCGVDVVGISNFVSFLEHTEAYRRDLRRAEYGDERDPEMRRFLLSIAPLKNAEKIVKPLFVVQGQNDPRVPASEAEQIVSTVRGNGGKVWYLLARDEGHGFQKKTNRDAFSDAMTLFFEENLLK